MDEYDPLLEDTKPDGIRVLRGGVAKDEAGMADIVLDDDGNYRIASKE